MAWGGSCADQRLLCPRDDCVGAGLGCAFPLKRCLEPSFSRTLRFCFGIYIEGAGIWPAVRLDVASSRIPGRKESVLGVVELRETPIACYKGDECTRDRADR